MDDDLYVDPFYNDDHEARQHGIPARPPMIEDRFNTDNDYDLNRGEED